MLVAQIVSSGMGALIVVFDAPLCGFWNKRQRDLRLNMVQDPKRWMSHVTNVILVTYSLGSSPIRCKVWVGRGEEERDEVQICKQRAFVTIIMVQNNPKHQMQLVLGAVITLPIGAPKILHFFNDFFKNEIVLVSV